MTFNSLDGIERVVRRLVDGQCGRAWCSRLTILHTKRQRREVILVGYPIWARVNIEKAVRNDKAFMNTDCPLNLKIGR